MYIYFMLSQFLYWWILHLLCSEVINLVCLPIFSEHERPQMSPSSAAAGPSKTVYCPEDDQCYSCFCHVWWSHCSTVCVLLNEFFKPLWVHLQVLFNPLKDNNDIVSSFLLSSRISWKDLNQHVFHTCFLSLIN